MDEHIRQQKRSTAKIAWVWREISNKQADVKGRKNLSQAVNDRSNIDLFLFMSVHFFGYLLNMKLPGFHDMIQHRLAELFEPKID